MRHAAGRTRDCRVHVIGAGLAGLTAALTLADAGRPVTVYEAAPVAGGRCRSYFDTTLGCRVDNGNHLLLSGNRAAFALLDRIGARDTLGGPGAPVFPFMDVASGARWTLRPGMGRVPWWVLSPSARVPGTRALDYLALLSLRRAGPEATVAQSLPANTLYRRLLEPLAIAALNTPPDQGSARLLAGVMQETLLRGGHACIPWFARTGWSDTLIDPLIAALHARGVTLRFGCRIAGLRIEASRVTALQTTDEAIAIDEDEQMVLAVPAPVACALFPGCVAPDAFQAIVNVHFKASVPPGPAGFTGLIGGTAEWVFVKPDHVSVTISAANRLVDMDAAMIAAMVWPDVRACLSLPEPMPIWRVVKERRASFAATSGQDARRPKACTEIVNMVLAGDWTQTGLPATIEGAIRSGRTAANLVQSAP